MKTKVTITISNDELLQIAKVHFIDSLYPEMSTEYIELIISDEITKDEIQKNKETTNERLGMHAMNCPYICKINGKCNCTYNVSH